MGRFKLIKMLQEYNPVAAEECIYKEKIIDFIEEHENCFERTLEIGHITASAWLLSKDKSKALLMHHFKLSKWFQLGGHCDGNPDVLSVAIKEAQEESGIDDIIQISDQIFDIDVHLIPQYKNVKEHYHYDIRFLLQVINDKELKQNNESKELMWIGKQANELPTDELSVVRMFNKWINLTPIRHKKNI